MLIHQLPEASQPATARYIQFVLIRKLFQTSCSTQAITTKLTSSYAALILFEILILEETNYFPLHPSLYPLSFLPSEANLKRKG